MTARQRVRVAGPLAYVGSWAWTSDGRRLLDLKAGGDVLVTRHGYPIGRLESFHVDGDGCARVTLEVNAEAWRSLLDRSPTKEVRAAAEVRDTKWEWGAGHRATGAEAKLVKIELSPAHDSSPLWPAWPDTIMRELPPLPEPKEQPPMMSKSEPRFAIPPSISCEVIATCFEDSQEALRVQAARFFGCSASDIDIEGYSASHHFATPSGEVRLWKVTAECSRTKGRE